MARFRPLASLAALAALAGCGGGGGPAVTGSASESARSESGLSAMWSKVRGLTVNNSKTVEMPALGLMGEAFVSDALRHNTDFRTASGLLLMYDEETGRHYSLEESIAHLSASFAKSTQIATPEQRARLGSVPHLLYGLPVLVAMQPRKGWEVNALDDRHVDPAFDTPFFRKHRRPSTYNPDEHRRYMEMLAISAIYTNDVFALIGEELSGVRLSDPDAAQARVIAAYQAIPPTKLTAALSRAAAQVEGGRFTTDLTGSGNIHFTHSPAGDFVGDARGVTWTKAGGVWFGDGRIAGQSVNFRLASTSSLARSENQSGNQGTTSGADVQGSGSIGAGK